MPQVYWAIQNGRYDTLKRLVDGGIDVNMLSEHGELFDIRETMAYHDLMHYSWWDLPCEFQAQCSPLALAAWNGQDSMVELLLDNGASIELESTELCGCCCVPLWCAEGLPEGPILSDESSRADYRDLTIPYNSWWTPMHYAICGSNLSTAKLLLERGANAGNTVGAGDCCVSALHTAVCYSELDMIEWLLDNNIVDINDQSDRGVTPLHLAYTSGKYDLVDKFLDERGADINLEFTGDSGDSGPWTIFSMACARGDFDRALQYLRRGADPNFLIKDNDCDDAWTAMRFIYGSSINPCPTSLRRDDVRILLELEIISRNRETTPSDSSV